MKEITGTLIHCTNSVQQRLRSPSIQGIATGAGKNARITMSQAALSRPARTCMQITKTSRKTKDTRMKASNAKKIQRKG